MTLTTIPCPYCDATGSTLELDVCGFCMGLTRISVTPPDRREAGFTLSVPIRPPRIIDEPPAVYEGEDGG
jgi:hypothetical protein